MYEYEHKSIKKYGARVCINIDKTLYKIQKWDFYKYNHIYLQEYISAFQYQFKPGENTGATGSKTIWWSLRWGGKKYKTSVTSKEHKQQRQAQKKCRLCTWFVEKTKKCKKLDKSQHCGGVGACPR